VKKKEKQNVNNCPFLTVATASQVHACAALLLLIVGNEEYDIGVASCGITFIPSFVKINELVEKSKWDMMERHNGELTSMLSFLDEERK
jgi:hypothetical protein